MGFPVEAIPDGDPFGPHHLHIAALLITVAVFVVWDNYRHQEPLLTFVGLLVAWFSFSFVWQYYHAAGAGLVFIGLLLVGTGLVATYLDAHQVYHWAYYATVLLGLLIALDDWVSHALGLWTPLDAVWEGWLIHLIS